MKSNAGLNVIRHSCTVTGSEVLRTGILISTRDAETATKQLLAISAPLQSRYHSMAMHSKG
jgi:hypothetical protein